MTPLAALLLRRIAAEGPITVADYMAECLLHPRHGYYTTRDPFGRSGDFITAPEISQMFGELAGLCLAQAWRDQGAPARFTLAELGPGRGTLMADALRATRRLPGFNAAAEVVLVEASPALRAVQAATLGPRAGWADRADDLPQAPLYLIANEFFDALPIRQFQRDGAVWRERMVGAGAAGALVFGLSPPVPCPDPRFADDPPGTVVEICPSAPAVMAALEDRLVRHGGAVLVIDYGGWRSRGDTLQALRAHAPDAPLAHPGEADLTAHVDFEGLVQSAPGLLYTPLTAQGAFLRALGIDLRAARLGAGLTGAALDNHRAAHRRLTHPSEMGSLCRAIAFHPPGTAPPPGFA